MSVTCTKRIGSIEVDGKSMRDFHVRGNLCAIPQHWEHLVTENSMHDLFEVQLRYKCCTDIKNILFGLGINVSRFYRDF